MNHTTPCGHIGPYTTTTRRVKDASFVVVQVRCNRPYGHDGDHAYSTMIHARQHVWDSDGNRVDPWNAVREGLTGGRS